MAYLFQNLNKNTKEPQRERFDMSGLGFKKEIKLYLHIRTIIYQLKSV